MKFLFKVSPHLKQSISTQKMMLELTIALMVVYLYSLCYYAMNYSFEYVKQAIILMATSLIVAVGVEIIWAKWNKKPIKAFLKSSFGWVTAIILTLMCPINIQPYALAIATLFSILFGKLLFGGFGQNICNPAAFGRAVILASFTTSVVADITTKATPTTQMASQFHWLVIDPTMIKSLFLETGSLKNLFFGNYAGGLGETCTALLIVIGFILALRKVIDWKAPITYLLTIFVLTSALAIFAGMGENFLWYPLYHLCVGGVMFGAVFMLTDPVTSPTSSQGRIIFGLGAGIITVLIRVLGNYPEGCLFAILIMNICTPAIEQAVSGKQLQLRKKVNVICTVLLALGVGSMFLASKAIEPAKPAKKEVKPTVKIPMDDEYIQTMDANLISERKNDDGTFTYVVSADGFASKEGINIEDYEHPTEPNEFEIILEADQKTIVAVNVTKMHDTEYIGDKIKNKKYLKQFVGKDLSTIEEVDQNDVVSGATYSVKSSMRALLEVKRQLGY